MQFHHPHKKIVTSLFAALLTPSSLRAEVLLPRANLGSDTGTNTISNSTSRVAPLYSKNPTWNDTTIGMGAYFETLLNRTAHEFESGGVGIVASFDQRIRSIFVGGIHARFGQWIYRKQFSPEDELNGHRLYPIAITSRIEAAPPGDFLGLNSVLQYFRPFAAAGLGYVNFFSYEDLKPELVKSVHGEPTGTIGAGFRIIWPEKMLVRISYEYWRGVETFRYTTRTWNMELQFGDLSTR